MTTIRDVLHAKGHDIWSVDPDSSVYDAIERMAEKNVGALIVLRDDKLVGIVSERDYARKVILKGKSSKDTLVREIMTSTVFFARPEQSLEDAMAMMSERDIRHLPVMSGEQLTGMISIGDLVRTLIAEKDHVIQHLENYITGARY